jgi:hypothetical protein
MNKYYTYAYLRKDGTPYYIGKGTGNRAHLQLNHKVYTPEKERVLYLKQNLTEEEANRHEVYMINVLGRKDNGTGILLNLTSGGEGISGYRHTEESKNKMRRSKSKEHARKVSEAIKAKWDNGDYDRETYRKRELGKKIPKETRKKIAESMTKAWDKRDRKVSEETRKKIAEGVRKEWERKRLTKSDI